MLDLVGNPKDRFYRDLALDLMPSLSVFMLNLIIAVTNWHERACSRTSESCVYGTVT